MATNEQIKTYIRKLVEEEVAKVAPKIIRETISRALGQLIVEASDLAEIEQPVRGNSEKRRALSEAVGMEEFPTMSGRTFTSERMTEVVNRKAAKALDIAPLPGTRELITVDSAMTENGTPVPINPNDIPKGVMKAMNHDYRKLMKTYLKGGGE